MNGNSSPEMIENGDPDIAKSMEDSEPKVIENGDPEIAKAMEILLDLIKNSDTKISTDQNYLLRYLYGTDFNAEEAFKKVKASAEHILECPEWYRKDGPLTIKKIIDEGPRVILPDFDKEGRPIFLLKNGKLNPSTMPLYDVIAVDDVWLEAVLSKNPELAGKGLCVIMDIKDQNWRLSKWMQPNNVRQSMKKIENLPFKDYKIHVVNNSWWISLAIKMTWPFLPQRYKDMIKFHFNNMESFYEYIDPKVLPPEYGGTKELTYAEIFEKLYARNDEIFRSYESYRFYEEDLL